MSSVIQGLCKGDLKWGERIPQDKTLQWSRWLNNLQGFDNLIISKCYTPEEFGQISHSNLHHFSEASERGFSQASSYNILTIVEKFIAI